MPSRSDEAIAPELGTTASEIKSEPRKEESLRPPPKKRRRIVISCTECHRRKQKCDRELPCANCISRKKESACRYDVGAPTAKRQQLESPGGAQRPEASESPAEECLPIKVADFGYSQTGASTLGFLKRIDNANPEEPLARFAADDPLRQSDHFATRERYKSLIRQLPPRIYVDKLVDVYFQEFNWQYYGLDRDVFTKQLAEWNDLPFAVLSTQGPQGLSPELRPFPALLFHVIATALLVLPPGPDATFDSLKYAGNMTFEDLAMDYSESGVAILSLLGKRQMSVTTVLAGFHRAAFLKYVAQVTEAWHAIGVAIRDAQEIGLHRDSMDPKPRTDDAEAVLENQWEIQRRRKVWMVLVGWDVYMGIVLGRPTVVASDVDPILPVDAPLPKDRSKTPIVPRGEDDPPTPLTRALWSYETMRPVRKIMKIVGEGPCPKDFSKVDQLHEELLESAERVPAYFRTDNTDTRFDSLPECHWLPLVRAAIPQMASFNRMALHRAFIFTRPKSRTEALKACLDMLQAQRLQFKSLQPTQYKIFFLFFGTFDAIVLMATIYIIFPREHPELLQCTMQHFHWSVERFQAMSERNNLAKAALSVLQAIYLRLKKSLGAALDGLTLPQLPKSKTSAALPASVPLSHIDPSLTNEPLPTTISATVGVDSDTPISNSTTTSATTDPYSSVPTSNSAAAELQALTPPEFSLPSDFDWSTIPPIYAVWDLACNDLTGIGNGGPAMPAVEADATAVQLPGQFGGGFTDNSVWNVLNQYTPY